MWNVREDVVGHHVVKSTCLRFEFASANLCVVVSSRRVSEAEEPYHIVYNVSRSNELCGAVAEGGHVVIVSRFGAHGQRRGTASKKLGAGVRV